MCHLLPALRMPTNRLPNLRELPLARLDPARLAATEVC
jgi:hypothetical protein